MARGLTGYKRIGKGEGSPTLTPAQERARRSVAEFRRLLPTLTAYARNLTGRRDVRVEMDAHSNGHTDGKVIYFRPPVALGDVESMRHDKSNCDKRDPKTLQLLCQACDVREDILATVYHEISHIAFDTFLQVGSDDVDAALEKIQQSAPDWYYQQVLRRYKDGKLFTDVDSFLKLAAIVNPYFKNLVNGLEDVRINERMAEARPGTRIMQASKIFKVAMEGVEQKRDGHTISVPWSEYELNLQASIGLFCLASGYPIDGWFGDRVETALKDTVVVDLCSDVPSLKSARKVFDRSFEIFLRMRELGFFVTKDEDLPEPPKPEPQPEPEPQENNDDDSESDGANAESDESSDSEGSDSERDEDTDSDSGGSAGGEDSDPDGGSDEGDRSDNGSGERSDDSDRDDEADSDAGSSDGDANSAGEPSSDGTDDSDGADGESDRRESDEGSGSDRFGSDEASISDDSPSGEEDGGVEAEGTESSDELQSDVQPGIQPDEGTEPESGDEAGATEGAGEGSEPGNEDGDAEASEGVHSSGSDEHDGDSSDGQPEGNGPEEASPGDGKSGVSEGEAEETGNDGSDLSDGASNSTGDSVASTDSGGDGRNDSLVPDERDDSAGTGPDEAESDGDSGESEALREDGDRGADSDSSEDSGREDGSVDGDSEEYVEPIDYRPEDERDGRDAKPEPIVPPTMTTDQKIELVDLGLHDDLEAPDGNVEQEIENAIIQGLYFTKPSSHVGGLRVWKYDEREQDQIDRGWHAWGGTYYDGFYGEQIKSEIDPVGEQYLGPALMKLRIAFADNQRSHRNRNQRAGKIDTRALGRRAWQTNDDRLFGKKVLPRKKDYFVCIGLDVSGSTRGVNLKMIKEAALAQAELCQRLGVKFAVYAHTGGPLSTEKLDSTYVDIYEIKAPDQPWDNSTREALMSIGPSAANLDGHTLEFYRKVCDGEQATNKVILYYSDGAMPLENYNEELEILQSEIALCKQKRYTLLGVGIRTDSPTRHGLDTVQVDDSSQVGKVVAHLERVLFP